MKFLRLWKTASGYNISAYGTITKNDLECEECHWLYLNEKINYSTKTFPEKFSKEIFPDGYFY